MKLFIITIIGLLLYGLMWSVIKIIKILFRKRKVQRRFNETEFNYTYKPKSAK